MAEWLAEGYEVTVAVLGPVSVRITAVFSASDNGCYVNYTSAKAAVGACLELAVPLASLPAASGDDLLFVVTVGRRAADSTVELERYPAGQPIALRVPDAGFDAAAWRV
jgi:hypothetical protein